MPLTDTAVRHAKNLGKNYSLRDMDGLHLFVSSKGAKSWHFRFSWLGKPVRISLGMYPELSLKDARLARENARALVAKGVDPRAARREDRFTALAENENSFAAVFLAWRTFKAVTLKLGRQTSLSQIDRIFAKDVLPFLGPLPIAEISRQHLIELLRRIESRQAFTTAEKCRTWFNQLFRYAMVEKGLMINPSADLDIVAIPKPPVTNNPYLLMEEVPLFLQKLRTYEGSTATKLGLRLLFLTGVRTGELRLAVPEQFDLVKGIWTIPAVIVKQLQVRLRKEGNKIPPYLVPLSRQAISIVRELLRLRRPAQRYLLSHRSDLSKRISENTLNAAIKRMGYERQLTGHGIRATLSTALNELGYEDKWIDAQLSHAEPNKIRATYNHALYVEQRQRMMQDWADQLDRWERGEKGIVVAPAPNLSGELDMIAEYLKKLSAGGSPQLGGTLGRERAVLSRGL
ncbi:integrase arm-type DNA-binding domain-containing protein [Pseudomonas synxantha]|uniref:Integrase n=1 Tax=Pseudomonas synxantha TaxID=47883 RepID=A0ACC6JRY7_9PSED|nr:integrase arm-type DNA-binding domain-containing protein [Pseudomonas synxantha]MDR6608994.1 integrase [Pseudomonas synxantha]